MIKQLNQEEFIKTMAHGMTDVTKSIEPVIDIWHYARYLYLQGFISAYVIEQELIAKIYRSNDEKYDHILLMGVDENVFSVIIVDNSTRTTHGYYILDLDNQYSIDSAK
jgi:hypothetical protein